MEEKSSHNYFQMMLLRLKGKSRHLFAFSPDFQPQPIASHKLKSDEHRIGIYATQIRTGLIRITNNGNATRIGNSFHKIILCDVRILAENQ